MPSRSGAPPDMNEFSVLVEEALESVPEEFLRFMENLPVVVEDEPSPELLKQMGIHGRGTLLGLYQGVPLPHQSVFALQSYPAKITIFRRPILRCCRSRRQVRTQIVKTVCHEIAHHFGLSDAYLRHLGY